MTSRRTNPNDRTFEQAEDERRKVRPARAAAILQRAMAHAETCVTRAALRLGMSEAYMRKLRAGDAQLDLRDLVGLAEHEPATFDALLDELASLRWRMVVDSATVSTVEDELAHAAIMAKETGEAVSTTVQAIASGSIADIDRAIRENEEAQRAIATQTERLRARRGDYSRSVAHVVRPRGVA